MALKCRTCNSECQFLTLRCLYDQPILLSQELNDDNTIVKLMVYAQKQYTKKLLGDCYTDLCTAISNSELDIADPDYEALATKWLDLINEMTILISLATEYTYLEKFGVGKLREAGFQFSEGTDGENFDKFLARREAGVKSAFNLLKDWLEETAQQNLYTCLPGCKDLCCDDDYPKATTTNHWGTTKSASYKAKKNTPGKFRGWG